MPTSGVTTASSQVTKLPSALKTSYSIKATLVTTRSRRIEEMCPACTGTHRAMGSNGKKHINLRLSKCETFISEPVDKRAMMIAAMNGSVLCLDWSGSHQARTCQAKDRQGKTFNPCKRQVNGSPCGKWHNHLLHGSRNNYCNSEKGVLTRELGVPNALGKVAPGMPTTNHFSIQKDSSKHPSVEEEQAKEAAPKKKKITASK